MFKTHTSVDRFAEALADWVMKWRWTVIVVTVLVVAVAGSGARHLEFVNNYRVFFSAENPELLAFEEFQNTYTKNDNILFVLQAESEDVFTPRIADAVERLTERAWTIPYAIRVDSITNFQHSWAEGDDLTVDDQIRNGAQLDLDTLARKQAVALAEPLLRGNLISLDADTTGINVTIQYPEKSITEVPEAVGVARQLADEIRAEFPDVHVAPTRFSMLNNAFAEAGQTDALTLIPIMYVVLIVVMILALRSFSSTIATLLVVALATVTAFGITGYLGINLDPINITAAVVILTLAIADSVHILVSMLTLMGEGKTKAAAIKDSLRINFLAVSITSLTTIVGFMALNFSDSPPFQYLGFITAMGITAAWLYSLTFLPAVLSLLPTHSRAASSQGRGLDHWLGRLAVVVTRRYRTILVITGALNLILVAQVPTLRLNDEFVRYFDHRIEFRTDTEFGIENLTGIYVIEYSVEAGSAGGISEPTYLDTLDSFTAWLNTQPEVRHVYSYTDIIRRLNKNMHGDSDDWYAIPDERDLAAQYLLLYELSLPFGLDLNDRIDIDKSATRLSVTLDELPTDEIRVFLDRAEAWLATNAPANVQADPTGPSVMFAYISQRNIESMIRGNAVSVILIAIIMMVALRSVALGGLSLIPNLVPVLMTYGVWAVLVGQVGMAAAIISATALGIVVDDTVNFLTKYLRARREKGYDRPEAIAYAFRMVGKAIVTTTVILASGFAVLSTSTFLINAQMGLLTALAIVIALVVDFLLLPALLMIGHQPQSLEQKEKNHDHVTMPQAA